MAAKLWLLPALSVCALLLAGTFFLGKYGYRKLMLMAMLGMVIGFLCFSGHFHAYNRIITEMDEKEVTVRGRVEDITEGERTRLLLRGSIEGEKFLHENVAVYVYPAGENIFTYGDTVEIHSHAEAPSAPRNFGETDYRYYCMGKGVYAFLYPTEGEIEKTGRQFSFLHPKDAAFALRSMVQDRLQNRTSPLAEGFLRALLTGDKGLMYAEASENLRAAGLSHIVAVSGLHLQIIIGAVMVFFGILKIRRRLFSVACYLLFIWFFVLFTGASASVLRAALMLSVFFFADFFRRDNDSLTALSVTAFFMCLINPGMLFDVGFRLSCASTFGILLFAGRIAEKISFLPRFLRTHLSVSLAAFLGFAPLAAYHFGMISLVGIFANLLVCPLLGFVMITGFLAVALADIPLLSGGLFWLIDMAVRYILGVAAFCAALGGAGAVMRKPGGLALMAYLMFITGAYMFTEKKRRHAAWIFCLCFALLAGELLGLIWLWQSASVTFLSVGNGDCALVVQGAHTMLFDSGGSRNTDVGGNTVLPYLRREGIAEIDAAFVTHYHTDHAAGFLSLLENDAIKTLYLPYHADDELKPALSAKALEKGISVRYLGDGDVVTMGTLSVSAFDAAAGSAENNGLLYRLDVFGTRTLFTGDIDKKGERRLVYRGADLDSDILKVPHHGADTSGLPEFTDAVSPAVAVISCGENHYGHPRTSILNLYGERNIPLYRTDKNGTVRVRISPDGNRRIETLR